MAFIEDNNLVIIVTPLIKEVAEVLKKKMPEISEIESCVRAYRFIELDDYHSDYFHHRANEDACLEAFDMKQDYGDEPFKFNKESAMPVAVNEPYFSEYLNDIIKNMRYRVEVFYEYQKHLDNGTVIIREG